MQVLQAVARHSKVAKQLAVVLRGAESEVIASQTYGGLLSSAQQCAEDLRALPHWRTGSSDRHNGSRVLIPAAPGLSFVHSLLGTWLAGGVAVPLSSSTPRDEVVRVIDDTAAAAIPSAQSFAHLPQDWDRAKALPERNASFGVSSSSAAASPELMDEVQSGEHGDHGAFIMYTSGTTGRPKGVLHTHRGLGAMTSTLVDAWGWQSADRILHALPLYHIHGLGNALLCPLMAGACIELLPRFSPRLVWDAFMRETDPVTVFMGVPTMYAYLLSEYESMDQAQQQRAQQAVRRLRLTVCGSAPCPAPVYAAWEKLAGQRLLDRYGMTETGMLLSNPLHGERRPGSVGPPLPGIETRLVPQQQEDGESAESAEAAEAGSAQGELFVRGTQLFKEYWNLPEATAADLSPDGWFRTGDVAQVSGNPPYFTLLGRASSDILKVGGHKVSALAIENVLAAHPSIEEVAVVGVPHPELGDQICAVVAGSASQKVTLTQLREHAASELAAHELPQQIVKYDDLPRNAMGKVNKKQLAKQVAAELRLD